MTVKTQTADLMTLAETATYLRTTPKALYWLRHTNRGPHSAKLGGRVVYRRADVDQWIRDGFNTGQMS